MMDEFSFSEGTDRKSKLVGVLRAFGYGVGTGIGSAVVKNLVGIDPLVMGGAGVSGAVGVTLYDDIREKGFASDAIIDSGVAATTSIGTYILADLAFSYFLR